MFNIKKHKKESQITSYEKYLRKENIGPKADDKQPIIDKMLPHRTVDIEKITEKQMNTADVTSDVSIIEKVLNEAKGYIPHRSDQTNLPVPPMSALVEKNRQKRLSEWKESKEDNWTVSFDDKKQLGDLPRTEQSAVQHDKIVLNNDPRRFEGLNNMPVSSDHKENASNMNNSKDITPLIGNITVADIDRAVNAIKNGDTIDYDKAIVSILKEAEREERGLNSVEERSITDLKIARTKYVLQK